MTIIEIIDLFTFYGLDIIMLSALTAIVTQILKVTILKKLKKKLMTFLPFALGTLVFAIYAGLRNMSFWYVLRNYVSILEHGLSVGTLATFIYVLYEQFVRERSSVSEIEGVISTLIEGYVPSENLQKAAAEIAKAIERDVLGDGATRAKEIIRTFAGDDVTDGDIQLLSKLIIETLAHLSTN